MSRSLSLRLYFAAAAALALSTLLPWFRISVEGGFGAFVADSAKPGAGGVLYLLLFAAAYGGAGYVLRTRSEPPRLATAMWVVNAWMVVNVFVIGSQLHDSNQATQAIGLTVTPGIGMLTAVAAVLAGIGGSVVLRRSRVLVAA